jgi:general secretion pathway protein C
MRSLLEQAESLLRRHGWVVPLVTLIPCAFFAARGTNDLFAANLFAADTEALARPLPNAAARARALTPEVQNHHVRDRGAIVHRNVFDSDAGCLDCDAGNPDAEVPDGGGTATPDNEVILPPEACDPMLAERQGQPHPGPCETQAKLVGAVVSDDMLWSFVFVQPTGSGAAMPFRFGQTIDGRSVGIIAQCPPNPNRPDSYIGAYVLLRPAGGGPRCFLAQRMPERAAAPVAAPVVAAVSAEPPQGGALGTVLDQIQRVGPNEFNIPRSAVDRILENQAELMRTTRIMPQEQGGRVVGVQLFGVRANSLLGRLGLNNGDVLNRINGLDIASPDRALEAYSRLRTSDSLQLSVTRNGQPVNIDFHIR